MYLVFSAKHLAKKSPELGAPNNLYCSAFAATELLLRKWKYFSTPPICILVRLPFVSQYASHLYRNTFGKTLVVVVTGMFPILLWSGKKKELKHKLSAPVSFGTAPGLSRGRARGRPWDKPGCPWNKPRSFPYFTHWKPSARDKTVRPWDKPGVEGSQ